MMRRYSIVLFALLAALCWPGRAQAHGLGATCRLKGPSVEIEAYYSDDTPAGGANVRVRDAAFATITEGQTDANGLWSFPRPAPGRYQVKIDAGGGHRMTRYVTIADPSAPPPETSPVPAKKDVERETFTAFPWLGVLAGLAIIAALAGGALLVGRRRRGGRG